MNPQTVYLTATPFIECAPESGDALPTRFSGVAYSGGVIPAFGVLGDTAIELASLQATDRVFTLINHDVNQRAGFGRLSVANNQLVIDGQFSDTDSGRQVASEMRDGAPWQMSVGIQYSAARMTGETVINGQSLNVKSLLKNARVLEVSFVPAGADPNTRVAAFAAETTEDSMSTEHEEKIAALESALKAETDKAAALQAALDTVTRNARMAAIQSLFADIGADYSDETAKPYVGIDDATFTAIAGQLRALKPKLDPALTRQIATAGKQPDDEMTAIHAAYASIDAQFKAAAKGAH